MASSRLATHLPSLFGPSRRAAWRLSLVRRALAAAALLLAGHLALGATDRATPPADAAAASGPALTLPLAAPADHLRPGDGVGIYLPGRADPIVTHAHVLAVPTTRTGPPTVRLTLGAQDVGELVEQMASRGAGHPGFVVVREE